MTAFTNTSAPRRFAAAGLLWLLCGATVFAVGCQKSQYRETVPTGVEVVELEDGRTQYLSTARASEAAIDSGNYVKKQNTSCGAARLQLENEYRRRGLGAVDYSTAEFFMIYEAEYCRVSIIR